MRECFAHNLYKISLNIWSCLPFFEHFETHRWTSYTNEGRRLTGKWNYVDRLLGDSGTSRIRTLLFSDLLCFRDYVQLVLYFYLFLCLLVYVLTTIPRLYGRSFVLNTSKNMYIVQTIASAWYYRRFIFVVRFISLLLSVFIEN
jgi:hypothetical protein